MKGNLVIQAIKLIYPSIQGGFMYWETQSNGELWENSIDGLVWENTQYPKPTWEQIEPLIAEVELAKAKEDKIAELEAFHDSPAVKTLTVNGVHKVSMLAEYRTLLREQIALMEDKVKFAQLQGQTIDINTLVWNFKLENNGFIPLNYLALVYISTTIMNITNPNFATKQTHIDAIKALTTIEEVNNYDFTADYILNQNINLA